MDITHDNEVCSEHSMNYSLVDYVIVHCLLYVAHGEPVSSAVPVTFDRALSEISMHSPPPLFFTWINSLFFLFLRALNKGLLLLICFRSKSANCDAVGFSECSSKKKKYSL